jgi:hypothetical protein
MRTVRTLIALLSLAAVSFGVVHAGGSNPEAANGGVFLHVIRNDGGPNDNTAAHDSFLVSEFPRANISPMTDGNDTAVIFATNNVTYSTGNQAHPFGFFYHAGRWYIYNVNGAHIAGNGGQAFNVQVQNPGQNVFVHTAAAPNTSNNYTTIDHPMVNGNAGALLSVTLGDGAINNPHHIGVFYNIISGRWAIFNQDMAAMPVGAAFNVQVLQDAAVDFKHTATAGTIFQTSKTEIDHPLLNDNLSAKIIVTQNWGSVNGVYNNNPIGVEFDNASHKWRIVNTNGAAMPENAMFNVHIAGTNNAGDGVLVNGGFEAHTNTSSKQAVSWNSAAAGAGSKRICNTYAPIAANPKIVANTGECSFLLKGAIGQTRKLIQNAPVSTANNGGLASALLWAKATNVSGLKVNVKVKMDDGNKVVFKLPGAELNGSYDWKPVGNSLLLPPTAKVTRVIVQIIITGGGKVYIDDVSSSIQHF